MSDIDDIDDEENDLIEDGPIGSPRSPLVPGADDEDDEDAEPVPEEDDPGEEFLYTYYNRQYYRIPKAKDGKAGWTRLYNRTIKVANGKLLGELNAGSPTAWEQLVECKGITADKVVVLTGKIKEDDPVMHNVWCILAEVEEAEGKADHKIVRHIPRSACKMIWEQIFTDPNLKESSLLKMPPYQDNVKAYNPIVNGLVKVQGEAQPKSAMVAVPKSAKRNASVDPAEEAHPLKKSKTPPAEAEKQAGKKAGGTDGPFNEGKSAQQAKKGSVSKPSGSSFFRPKSPSEKDKVSGDPPHSPSPARLVGAEEPAAQVNAKNNTDSPAAKTAKPVAKTHTRAEETPSGPGNVGQHEKLVSTIYFSLNANTPKTLTLQVPGQIGKPTNVRITAVYSYD